VLLKGLLAGPELSKMEKENEFLTPLDKFLDEPPSDRHKDNAAVPSEIV